MAEKKVEPVTIVSPDGVEMVVTDPGEQERFAALEAAGYTRKDAEKPQPRQARK